MKGSALLVLITQLALAQPSLKIDKGVAFQLTGDSFSIDSLIMADSSALLLDNRHANNLVRANFVSIGSGCILNGAGNNGEDGPAGADGSTALYAAGKAGRGGFSAVNLFFNFTSIQINGVFQVFLIGGKGGNGGPGGSITKGPAGIAPVPGSTYYSNSTQGAPGNGGDGGRGGNITLSFPIEFKDIVQQRIAIVNTGGEGGLPATSTDTIPSRTQGGKSRCRTWKAWSEWKS